MVTVLCKEPFFKDPFQLFCTFPVIFSFLRVVSLWPWLFYWRIALTLRNIFHTQNMFLNWFPTIPYSHLKQNFSKKSVKKWGKKVVYGAFVKDHLQLFLHFLHLFSFPRVIWTWFFYWCIALTLGNVFHTQNMFLNWFPTILRPFEAKVFDEKCQKVTFGQTQKWVLDFWDIFKSTFSNFCFKWP